MKNSTQPDENFAQNDVGLPDHGGGQELDVVDGEVAVDIVDGGVADWMIASCNINPI